MAILTVQKASISGLILTLAAATAGGDTFSNDGKTKLHAKNGGASPLTITVTALRKCNQGFLHNAQVTVAAGETRIIGPFDPAIFGANPAITYSGVTSLTVGVVNE